MVVLPLSDFAKNAIPALKFQEGILAVIASALVRVSIYSNYRY